MSTVSTSLSAEISELLSFTRRSAFREYVDTKQLEAPLCDCDHQETETGELLRNPDCFFRLFSPSSYGYFCEQDAP